MSTQMRDRQPGDGFPVEYKYDKVTQNLEVVFPDGEQIRYYDVDPRLAFLNHLNRRRNADFLTFANQRVVNPYHHRAVCQPTGVALKDSAYCVCPFVVKREVIQEATEELPQSQTRPLLVAQQTEGGHK